VLTARHDKKLEQAHPSSRGIYWERKPPLPPDEQLETLGWPHILRAYARMLVERELSTLAPEFQERVVEDLLRSGKIGALVRVAARSSYRSRRASERRPTSWSSSRTLRGSTARWRAGSSDSITA
jgi:hypothetical protein